MEWFLPALATLSAMGAALLLSARLWPGAKPILVILAGLCGVMLLLLLIPSIIYLVKAR